MNQSGEPGRDDFGLPPIDVEIPDDARDLDRDVQAYHRELRAVRRQQRASRFTRPLTRDGVLLPLIAGCIALFMVAGVLLSALTAGPGSYTSLSGVGQGASNAANRSPRAASVAPATGTSPAVVPVNKLPDSWLAVGHQRVPLRSMRGTLLALIPAGCACGVALGQLVSQAQSAGIPVYLVGTGATMAEVTELASRTPGHFTVADDPTNVLRDHYPSAGNLSALLVGATGAVTMASPLRPGLRLGGDLRALHATGASPSA